VVFDPEHLKILEHNQQPVPWQIQQKNAQ
jgi:hypothetical protein